MKNNAQASEEINPQATPTQSSNRRPCRTRKQKAELPHDVREAIAAREARGMEVFNQLRSKETFRPETGGFGSLVEMDRRDCLGFLSLAIFGVEGALVSRWLPTVEDTYKRAEWAEALRIAETLIQRLAVPGLSGEQAEEAIRIPLPGLAGVAATRTRRELLTQLAFYLHADGEDIARVIGRVIPQHRLTLFLEALAIAEELVDADGNQTERDDLRQLSDTMDFDAYRNPTNRIKMAREQRCWEVWGSPEQPRQVA